PAGRRLPHGGDAVRPADCRTTHRLASGFGRHRKRRQQACHRRRRKVDDVAVDSRLPGSPSEWLGHRQALAADKENPSGSRCPPGPHGGRISRNGRNTKIAEKPRNKFEKQPNTTTGKSKND